MITVAWPSTAATHAEIWRILDLSGMTNNVRESRNFTRAGYVYLNGAVISGLKAIVLIGDLFTLELRFPNGKIVSREIRLVPRAPIQKVRSNTPTTFNRRG